MLSLQGYHYTCTISAIMFGTKTFKKKI
uniref:Uncharacterized protein n=1 Tax=Anguilla anguilla TaxID=7936 RepID=A0A0E9RCK0_ANGAN